MALVLLLSEFAVFSELGGEVRVGFLLVGIAVARIVVSSGVEVTRVAGVVFIVAVVFIFIGVGSSGVAGVGAFALVIGALRLWGAQSFPGHFRAAFPVMRVNGLGEGVGFANASNLILDSGQESMVQWLAEGSFTPLDVSSEVIEVDQVLHYALVFMHAEVFKVSLCFTFGIVWSEVLF